MSEYSHPVSTLSGAKGDVLSVAISFDGKYVTGCSGAIFSTTPTYDPNTFKGVVELILTLPIELILAWVQDSKIRIWNRQDGTIVHTLQGHWHWVTCVTFSPNGRILASIDGHGVLKLWDTQAGRNLRTLKGHSDWGTSVAFSPDGNTLASASDDATIKLWNVDTGEELSVLEAYGRAGGVGSITFSADGQTLIGGYKNGSIRLWDIATQQEFLTLWGHYYEVNSVTVSQDGQTLASSDARGIIKLWNLTTRQELRSFKVSDYAIYTALHPTRPLVASGDGQGILKLWDGHTAQELCTLAGHSKWITSLTFSLDGQMLVSGSADKTVKIWHLDENLLP